VAPEQAAQDVALGPAAAVPGEQGVQAAALAPEELPAGQGVHDPTAPPAAKEPAGQGEQVAAEAPVPLATVLKVPAGHEAHESAPAAVEKVPVGHGEHVAAPGAA